MKYLSFFLVLFLFASCSDDEGENFDMEIEEIKSYISDKGWTAIETASGLHYVVVNPGIGTETPAATSEVSVTYRGEFFDGIIFDQSTNAIKFNASGVIKGWTEGLQLMNQGATHYMIIPSRLAYGVQGRNSIPPNTPLFFEVTLISWE